MSTQVVVGASERESMQEVRADIELVKVTSRNTKETRWERHRVALALLAPHLQSPFLSVRDIALSCLYEVGALPITEEGSLISVWNQDPDQYYKCANFVRAFSGEVILYTVSDTRTGLVRNEDSPEVDAGAMEYALEILRGPDEIYYSFALCALSCISGDHTLLAPFLVPFLSSDEHRVVVAALAALARCKDLRGLQVAQWLPVARHSNSNVRIGLWKIMEQGTIPTATIEDLCSALLASGAEKDEQIVVYILTNTCAHRTSGMEALLCRMAQSRFVHVRTSTFYLARDCYFPSLLEAARKAVDDEREEEEVRRVARNLIKASRPLDTK